MNILQAGNTLEIKKKLKKTIANLSFRGGAYKRVTRSGMER